jgi:hypothetical protein
MSLPPHIRVRHVCAFLFLSHTRTCDSNRGIYTGTIFDVTRKADVYGAGKSYNIFAGKDGSRGLGMSSLKEADAVADYSTLEEKETKVLDDWYKFFKCVSLTSVQYPMN